MQCSDDIAGRAHYVAADLPKRFGEAAGPRILPACPRIREGGNVIAQWSCLGAVQVPHHVSAFSYGCKLVARGCTLVAHVNWPSFQHKIVSTANTACAFPGTAMRRWAGGVDLQGIAAHTARDMEKRTGTLSHARPETLARHPSSSQLTRL